MGADPDPDVVDRSSVQVEGFLLGDLVVHVPIRNRAENPFKQQFLIVFEEVLRVRGHGDDEGMVGTAAQVGGVILRVLRQDGVSIPVQEFVDQTVLLLPLEVHLLFVHQAASELRTLRRFVLRGEQPVGLSALAEGVQGHSLVPLAPDAVPVVPGQLCPCVGLFGAVGGKSDHSEGALGRDFAAVEKVVGFADKPHDRGGCSSLHWHFILELINNKR